MSAKTVSLDDLLSDEERTKLSAKRAKNGTLDLSDLITKKDRPPPLEILEAIQVVFTLQDNFCLHCHQQTLLPIGLVAMHKVKRHGRVTNDLMGIALTEANQHPHLERVQRLMKSTSICCAACVEDARTAPTPPKLPLPTPLSPDWYEQHLCADRSDIHRIEAAYHHKAEIIRRELEAGEEKSPLPVDVPLEVLEHIEVPEVEEPTYKEDTQ